MKTHPAKKVAVLLIVSILLSVGIVRWQENKNVPFCINTAGCRGAETIDGKKIIGDVKVTNFGFPLEYRHVERFRTQNPPNPRDTDQSGYSETELASPSFSLPSIIINVIFWFALLHLLSGLLNLKKDKTAEKSDQPAT